MDEQTLYSFKVNYTQNETLVGQLLPLARKYLSDKSFLTNEWNYKNTYSDGEGLSLEPELKFFVDYILEQSYSYLEKNNLKLRPTQQLWVSLFASEMQSGDQHEPHAHPGALLSGLVYLQVPPNSSKLEFKSPRHISAVWRNLLEETSYAHRHGIFEITNDHTIVIHPTPGLFLFWESWALHRVPVNHSADGRITMVFNVGIKDL